MRHPYRPHLRAKIRRPPPECDAQLSSMIYRHNAGRQNTDQSVLRDAIATLMEHFDTVQVVVTRRANDGTIIAAEDSGNFYARVGSVHRWLTMEDEQCRVNVREGERFDDGDDDELPASA